MEKEFEVFKKYRFSILMWATYMGCKVAKLAKSQKLEAQHFKLKIRKSKA